MANLFSGEETFNTFTMNFHCSKWLPRFQNSSLTLSPSACDTLGLWQRLHLSEQGGLTGRGWRTLPFRVGVSKSSWDRCLLRWSQRLCATPTGCFKEGHSGSGKKKTTGQAGSFCCSSPPPLLPCPFVLHTSALAFVEVPYMVYCNDSPEWKCDERRRTQTRTRSEAVFALCFTVSFQSVVRILNRVLVGWHETGLWRTKRLPLARREVRRGVWFAQSPPRLFPSQWKSFCSSHFRFDPSLEYPIVFNLSFLENDATYDNCKNGGDVLPDTSVRGSGWELFIPFHHIYMEISHLKPYEHTFRAIIFPPTFAYFFWENQK